MTILSYQVTYEEQFLLKPEINDVQAGKIEEDTVNQSTMGRKKRKFRVTSSNAHKIFIRQKKLWNT